MLPVTKRMDKSKRKGNYIVTRILVGLILSILMRKKNSSAHSHRDIKLLPLCSQQFISLQPHMSDGPHER